MPTLQEILENQNIFRIKLNKEVQKGTSIKELSNRIGVSNTILKKFLIDKQNIDENSMIKIYAFLEK